MSERLSNSELKRWATVRADDAGGLSRELLALRARVAQLEAELETERMRLDACGVVANANTASSAEEQRKMHPNYWSASCGDVAKAVDREMALRARVAKLEAALKDVRIDFEMWHETTSIAKIDAALKDAP